MLVSPAALANVVIRQITVRSESETTQLAVDASGAFKPKIFTLASPDRLVIDIPDARLQSNRAISASQGKIRNVRTAARNGGLRIVADLDGQARVRTIVTSGRNCRVVIEVAGATGSARKNNDGRETTPPVSRPVRSSEPVLAQPREPAREIIIAVDAGHGGDDPGAIGRNSTQEKNVTLAIARELKQQIDREPGLRAVLTRDGDYFVPLRERINRARENKADLFVSVHADSYVDRSLAGSSVYILSQHGATNEASRWLAERENAADLVGGISLEDKDPLLASVLLDLSQGASMSASMDAANKVLVNLDRVGNVHRKMVQQAGFVVLKSPDIPSMLVETAFISNPVEEARLGQRAHQQRLASAISAGLRQYFYENPPSGTHVAQLRNQAANTALATTDVGALSAARVQQ
jgi:N-acetylmuramoyl-L-alanine amidase